MKKYTFKNAVFKKTATRQKEYPILRSDAGIELPEIAIAGRSNVGKSSLLNHLFQAKGLVKTSSVPGKTQALNFFVVNNELSFVDLPGYGYAKVPLETRKKWGPMVQEYFDTRTSLQLILFLFDIRRLPTDEDRELLECICQAEKSMIMVFTKVDKVSKNEKSAQTQKILSQFGAENIQWLHYSSTKNIGQKALMQAINEALAENLEALDENLEGTQHGADE